MMKKKIFDLKKQGIPILTVILAIVFAVLLPSFSSIQNVNIIGLGRVPVAIFAMASLVPLAAGEFDISLGYMIGFLMMAGGKTASTGGTVLEVVAVILGLSIILGILNGIFTVFFKIPSTISTLAAGMIMYGGSLFLNGGRSFSGVTPNLLIWINRIKIAKLNIGIWICLLLAIIIYLIMEHSPLGRYIYATGNSRSVVELAGINTKAVRFLSFVMASILIGFCAIILISQTRNIYPDTGPAYLLPGLAVVFLSITMHTPGRYNIPGVIWSAVLLGMFFNVINILGAPFWAESVINGLVLLGVVIIMRQN